MSDTTKTCCVPGCGKPAFIPFALIPYCKDHEPKKSSPAGGGLMIETEVGGDRFLITVDGQRAGMYPTLSKAKTSARRFWRSIRRIRWVEVEPGKFKAEAIK